MSERTAEPNVEQIAYWNEESGKKWAELQARLDAGISPFGLEAIERSGVGPGERVLDVGCGCGQTSLQLAERVGKSGAVLGLDISRPMLTRARERAAERGAAHLRFEEGDAQVFPLEAGSFDLVFSRFGVMFFEDPVAAFRNLRGAVRAGGRLAFLCWQGIERNPFMAVPYGAVARHVEMPPPPPPGSPGPLSLADPARIREILEGAGWQEVAVEHWEREFLVGGEGTLDEAVAFSLQVGPASRVLKAAAGAIDMDAVIRSLREALTPFASDAGVRMPCGPTLVTART